MLTQRRRGIGRSCRGSGELSRMPWESDMTDDVVVALFEQPDGHSMAVTGQLIGGQNHRERDTVLLEACRGFGHG